MNPYERLRMWVLGRVYGLIDQWVDPDWDHDRATCDECKGISDEGATGVSNG